MKKINILKNIRIILAIITFSIIIFFFIDFAEILPIELKFFTKIQFVSALFSLNFIILAIIFIFTLVFGRIYCSIICPMGVFQDIIAWFSKKIFKKRKYKYYKPKHILRLSVLGFVIISWFLSYSFVLGLLEPYSSFGRIAVNIFKPIYIAANNLLENIFTNFEIYTFYKEPLFITTTFSFVTTMFTLLIIIILSTFWGRIYCNTICPVGTFLGYLAKLSIFKIRINEEKCNKCGLCVKKCKALCINSIEAKVDYSRCINCFNCLESCSKKALSFSIYKYHKKLKNNKKIINLKNDKYKKDTTKIDENLRKFLVTVVAAGLTLPKAFANKKLASFVLKIDNKKEYNLLQPISPPGSQSIEHFNKKCTSCYLCISKCSQKVLKPAFKEYGIKGIMQPVMKFDKGFCNFDCTICSEVCPNAAILPLTKEQKHLTQVGKVVFLLENCIVHTDGTSCGACSEHCPTQAVTMKTYKNGLTIPQINQDLCVGCGGCEYICPVRPYRAIHVEANKIHLSANPIEKNNINEIKIDDFGF